MNEADLRGDLHRHTDLTDGLASVEDMVAAAAKRGYGYDAVTDHAPNLHRQRMSEAKMLAQRARLTAGTAPRAHRSRWRRTHDRQDGEIGGQLAGRM